VKVSSFSRNAPVFAAFRNKDVASTVVAEDLPSLDKLDNLEKSLLRFV